MESLIHEEKAPNAPKIVTAYVSCELCGAGVWPLVLLYRIKLDLVF